MNLALRVTKPLPAGGEAMTIPLDPLVTSCKVSTALPGGFNALAIGLPEEGQQRRYYLAQPADIVRFAHVEARMGAATVFEGRVMQRHMPGGQVLGFQAVGYGLTGAQDDYYRSASGALTTSGIVLRDVLTVAPLLTISTKPGDWVDPGLPHARSEFDGKFPYEVINQLSSEGGGGTGTGGTTSAGWDWAVWDGRSASWKPRTPPTTAHYLIDLANVTLDESLNNMYGTVAVTYGSTKIRTSEKTDPSFSVAYGFRRALNIPGSSQTQNAARQFRDTQAAQRAIPDYAVKITLTAGQGLTTPQGEIRPAWLVRAGEWIQAGDLPMLCILHTEYDAMADTATLTVGAYPRDWYEMVRETWRVMAAYKRLVNPNSGAGL